MATVTDSTAGTTTTHRVITGLTPDTLYICRVRIYNSSTGALVAETNSISVRTLAQSTSQATVSILNFLDNLTQLASGSFKGDIGDTFYISAAGTQYQTYSQQYHFLYFRLSSQNYSTEHDASYPIPIQEGQTVKVLVLSTENGKINLSIKRTLPQPERPAPRGPRPGGPRPPVGGGAPRPAQAPRFTPRGQQPLPPSGDQSFEDKLKQFLSSSEGKMADLNRSIDGKRGGGRRRK